MDDVPADWHELIARYRKTHNEEQTQSEQVREGGRVVNVAVLVATGVNADGHREVLGLQVTTAEDGAGSG